MNIVVSHHPELATLYGVGVAMVGAKLNAVLWQSKDKPVYDMLEEKKPEFLFCSASDITPTFLTAVEEYKVKIVLFNNGCPDYIKPVLLCVDQLTPVLQKNLTIPYLEITNAANYTQYHKGFKTPKDECDVFYLSNSIGDRKYILDRLATVAASSLQLKICGATKVPFAEYLGNVNIYDTSNLFASAKVVLDFDDDHIYDIAANKGFCLSSAPHPFYPQCKPTDLIEQIQLYISNPKLRTKFAKQAYKAVMAEHTYFHRLLLIGETLECPQIISACKSVLKEISK